MDVVASRTYRVKRSEFPLTVTIEPKKATGNAATTVVIGHVREMKNGAEVLEQDVKVADSQGIITYQIAAPQSGGSVDLVQTLLGFFAKAEGEDARFAIVIETAQQDRVETSIRRPTFNPGTATLKVQVQ